MEDLQEQVKDVCRFADAVIKDPTTSIVITAGNIGVCGAVAIFAAGGKLLLSPLFGHLWMVIAVGKWIAKKLGAKEKQQEKERMLREVIRKQQAVINKLNQELAKSRQQNAQNRQEIKNLNEILRMLKETEGHLKAA